MRCLVGCGVNDGRRRDTLTLADTELFFSVLHFLGLLGFLFSLRFGYYLLYSFFLIHDKPSLSFYSIPSRICFVPLSWRVYHGLEVEPPRTVCNTDWESLCNK